MPDSTTEFPFFAPRRASRGLFSTRTTRSEQEGGRQQQDYARRAQRREPKRSRASRLHPSPPATFDENKRLAAILPPRLSRENSNTPVQKRCRPSSLPRKERTREVWPVEDRGRTKKRRSGHRPSSSSSSSSPKSNSFLHPLFSSSSKLTCAPPLARALVRRPRASLLASRRSVDDSIGVVGFFEEEKTKSERNEKKLSFFFFRGLFLFTLNPLREKKRSKQKADETHTLFRAFSAQNLCSSARTRRSLRDLEHRHRKKKAAAQENATAKLASAFSPPPSVENVVRKENEMNDAPADYVKLAPARHPPRAAAETPEGRAWRRYRDPLVTKMVSREFVPFRFSNAFDGG